MLRRGMPLPQRGAVVDKAVYHEGQKDVGTEVEKCWLWKWVLCNRPVCFPPKHGLHRLWKKQNRD